VVVVLVDTVALVGLVATTRAAVPRHQARQEPQEQVARLVAVVGVLVLMTRPPALKCMAPVEGVLAAGLALRAPALAGQARLERHTTHLMPPLGCQGQMELVPHSEEGQDRVTVIMPMTTLSPAMFL
jgi:hypothetical protein